MTAFSAEPLVDAIKKVLTKHGTNYLFPDDEFDCCAEEVAALFERVAWFQPARQVGERFWNPKWEPSGQWAQPVVPVYAARVSE